MATEGQVISCDTIEEWNHNLDSAKESHKLVVVDFTASWCGPCQRIAPMFADCAKKYPQILFLKVDVDGMQDTAEEWGIRVLPTIIFLKDGEKVGTMNGFMKGELDAAVLKHSTSTTTTSTTTPSGTTSTS